MSGLTNVLKKGWHPDKDKDLKSQVTSIWKQDSSPADQHANHNARPLRTLRDPASFGPPPRHVALGSGVSAGGPGAVSEYRPPEASARPAMPSRPTAGRSPGGRSPSPPAYQRTLSVGHHATRPGRRCAEEAGEEEEEVPSEPRPYRMDTTGLDTSHLPPPPTRRDGTGVVRSPAPPPASTRPTARPVGPPPSLPPRLPPRSPAALTPNHSSSSTGTDGGYINQAAANRLGRAGISVPGLGIGAGDNTSTSGAPTAISAIGAVAAARPPPSPPATQPALHQPPASQLSELQARFSKMGTGGGVGSGGGGAGRTPSRSPARPAGVSAGAPVAVAGATAAGLVAGKKKPPPPPAKKKPGLASAVSASRPDAPGGRQDEDEDDDAPPPIPMATRPHGR